MMNREIEYRNREILTRTKQNTTIVKLFLGLFFQINMHFNHLSTTIHNLLFMRLCYALIDFTKNKYDRMATMAPKQF